jgi:hypothetical protein
MLILGLIVTVKIRWVVFMQDRILNIHTYMPRLVEQRHQLLQQIKENEKINLLIKKEFFHFKQK